MTSAGMKVRDGRRWQASGLFQSSHTCCENDDRWHVEGAPSAVKLAQRAPPADSLCDSFPILISYGEHVCVYKRERGSKTDKFMSVYTFVLTYSMGDSCKHLDCIFTQRCSFFCRHVFVKEICEVVYLSQKLVFSMLFTTFNLGTCIYFKIVFLKVLIFLHRNKQV